MKPTRYAHTPPSEATNTIERQPSELERLKAIEHHMAACRSLLSVPDDETLYGAIEQMKWRDKNWRALVMATTEDEAALKRLCADVLGQDYVDGDSMGTPGPVECVKEVIKRMKARDDRP